VGAVLKQFAPHVKVIAVQSEASAYLHHLFHQGSQAGVVELESLADGLAGAVEEGAITIPLVKQVVDDFVLVSEEEIGRAIAFAWRRYGERIEGSAAVSLAAARRFATPERPAIVLLTGGNIQPETHAGLLAQYPQEGI
jgi:threonine dehydratase